jgi:AAA domain/SEN1 N terminal
MLSITYRSPWDGTDFVSMRAVTSSCRRCNHLLPAGSHWRPVSSYTCKDLTSRCLEPAGYSRSTRVRRAVRPHVVMSSLAADLLLLRSTDPRAFFRALLDHVRGLNGAELDHWWCAAPAIMTELLPLIASSGAGADHLRAVLTRQLTRCRSCVRHYHAAVDVFCAESELDESEKLAVAATLRGWDAERLLPELAETVLRWRNASRLASSKPMSPAAVEELRERCETLFFETLLDGRLTMRVDIAASIASMFAVFNPVITSSAVEQDNEHKFVVDVDDMCLPGMYVLCFHSSPAVRGWAQRCVLRYTTKQQGMDVGDLLPPVIQDLTSLCVSRIENRFEATVIDLTDDGAAEFDDVMFPCAHPVLWEGFAILATCLPVLQTAIKAHPSLLSVISYNLSDGRHDVVQHASVVLAHLLRVLGYRSWLSCDAFRPLTLVECISQAYMYVHASDIVKTSLLEVFDPFLRSLTAVKREEADECMRRMFDFLFDACTVPHPGFSTSLYRNILASHSGNGVTTAKVSVGLAEKSLAYKTARDCTARIIARCYVDNPSCITIIDSERVASLLESMFSETVCSESATDLLRAVLLTDVRSILQALTSPEVSVLAMKEVEILPRRESLRPCTLADMGFANSDVDDVDDDDGSSGDGIARNGILMPTDMGGNSEFLWAKGVWQRMRRGRFRILTLGSSHHLQVWPEGPILLDVHRLIGMLHVHDDMMSLESAAGREALLMQDLRAENPKIFRASVEHAYIMAIASVEEQLLRVLQQKSRSREVWLEHLSFASGHLMASCRKRIRSAAFSLLSSICSVPNTSSSFGSVSAMATRSILSDSALGNAVMLGTGAATRLLSIYGPRFSFRSYLHMARWLHQLFDTNSEEIGRFLQDQGRTQVTCMAEQFLLNWEDQLVAHPKLFSEAMSRFLASLIALWPRLIGVSSPVVTFDDDSADMEPTNHHEDLLTALLYLQHCDDSTVQSKWVSLVSDVATRFGFSTSHREVIAKLMQSSEIEPARFTAGACALLTSAFGLPTVLHPRVVEVKTAPDHGCMASRVRQIPVPDNSMYELPRATAFGDNRCESATEYVTRVRLEDDLSRILAVEKRLKDAGARNSRRHTAVGAAMGAARYELVGIAPGNRSSKLNALAPRNIAAPTRQRVQHVVKKGPTKMELLVAANKKSRVEKSQGASTAAETSCGRVLGASDSQTLSVTRPLPGIAQRRQPEFVDLASRKAAAELAAKKARRHLRPRDHDRFHSRVISWAVASIVDVCEKRGGNVKKIPASGFETSEEYVVYWESLLLEEMRAHLAQCLEDERQLARQSTDDGSSSGTKAKWACRTPFEVAQPAEPRRGFKLLVVRYCGGGTLRESSLFPKKDRHDNHEDRSAANLRVHDVVRLQMARHGRGSADGGHSSTNVDVMLGCVSSVDYQGREVMVTIKVKFPSSVTQPGQGRAVCVSKLLSLTTHHRQMEALWRVNTLSDAMLFAILQPAASWRGQKKLRQQQSRFSSSVMQVESLARRAVINNVTENGLNPSQLHVVNEVACAAEKCARLASDPGNAAVRSGAFTLLQGPPGTGKTSTIVSVLSVLLAESLAPQTTAMPLRKRTVVVGETPVSVSVAPFRVLVCAPSNAAVDELLIRVMNQGLQTPIAGVFAVPRVLRVGAGSKYDDAQSVSIFEMMDRSKSEFLSADHEKSPEMQAAYLERDDLRRRVREISAEVGEAHETRKAGRTAYDIAVADAAKSQVDGMSGAEREVVDESHRCLGAAFDKEDMALTQKLSKLHSSKLAVSRSLTVADQRVKQNERRREVDSTRRLATIVNNASIVFATLNAAGHDALGHMCGAFDAVIVDEAAQSVEPEMLISLAGANPRSTSTVPLCVMVGDPKQLPATILSTVPSVVEGLGRSLFERLQDAKHSRVHLLNTQYRMHPDISRFPSARFYNGRLQNGASVKSIQYHQPYHFDARKRFGPLSFMDTSNCSSAGQNRASGGSICNPGEAEIVCLLLAAIVRLYPDEGLDAGKVAILTPYKRQVSELRRRIQTTPALQGADIEVNTVDGIQGREKQVVILSTVRSGTCTALQSSSGIGFVKDERRMNVALTRARLALIVVGNASVLAQGSPHWAAQIEDCRSHGRVSLVKSAKSMFPEAFGPLHRLKRASGLPCSELLPCFSDTGSNDADAMSIDSDVEVVWNESDLSSSESDADMDIEIAGRDEMGSRLRTLHGRRLNNIAGSSFGIGGVAGVSPVPLGRAAKSGGHALPPSRPSSALVTASSLVDASEEANARLRSAIAIRESSNLACSATPVPSSSAAKKSAVKPSMLEAETTVIMNSRPCGVDAQQMTSVITSKRRRVEFSSSSSRKDITSLAPPQASSQRMTQQTNENPLCRSAINMAIPVTSLHQRTVRQGHALAAQISRGERDSVRTAAIMRAMTKPTSQAMSSELKATLRPVRRLDSPVLAPDRSARPQGTVASMFSVQHPSDRTSRPTQLPSRSIKLSSQRARGPSLVAQADH